MQFLARHSAFARRLSICFGVLTVCLLFAGCAAPQWLTDAEALIPILASSVGTVLSFLASLTGNPVLAAAAAAVGPIITLVGDGLHELQVLIEDYKGKPSDTVYAKIEAVAVDIQSHLSEILSSVLPNLPAPLAAKIQQWVTLVQEQLEAWLQVLPSIHTLVSANQLHHFVAFKPADDRILSAAELKSRIHAIFEEGTEDPDVNAALATARATLEA